MRRRTERQDTLTEDYPAVQRKPNGMEALKVPHDVVNELVVIAAVLVDAAARNHYLRTLNAGQFFGDGHADVWVTLQEMHRRELSFDPATVRSLNPKVDVDLLTQLMHERPVVPPNLRHHVDLLQWDAARIGVARGPMMEILEAFRDPKTTPERMRGLALQLSAGLKGYGNAGALRTGRELVAEQSLDLSQRRSGRAIYSFGIPALDQFEAGHPNAGRARLIPGTAPGQMTVVTGLSGAGKSTTMANAQLGYVHAKRKTLVGAWEVGSAMSLEIAAIVALGFNRADMSEGLFTAEEQRQVEEKMEELSEWLTFFEIPVGRGKRGSVNDEQMDRIEQAIVDTGCEIFIADLFRRALRETRPEDEEAALIRMQAMAKTTRSHFILVQQQSVKGLENADREDKKPTRDNIKGSAAWVEMPDTIIGWHRPALHKNVPDDCIEAYVLKQRYGKWPMGVSIQWDPEYGWLGEGTTIRVDESQTLDGGLEKDDFETQYLAENKRGGKSSARRRK